MAVECLLGRQDSCIAKTSRNTRQKHDRMARQESESQNDDVQATVEAECAKTYTYSDSRQSRCRRPLRDVGLSSGSVLRGLCVTASNESGAFDGFLHSRDAQALLSQLSQGTEVLSAPGPVPREVPGYRNRLATRLASRTSQSKISECSEIPNSPQSCSQGGM